VFPDDWYNALNNHSMDSIVSTIGSFGISFTAGVKPNVQPGVPDSALPLSQIVQPIINVISSNPLVTQFAINFPVATAVAVGAGVTAILAGLLALDPSNSASTELVGDASSPNFSGFELPSYTGVASYSYSLQVDGSWQASQTSLPGGIIQTPAHDTGIEFQALNASGGDVTLPTGFILGTAFDSTGTFNGSLTETQALCFCSGTLIMTERGEVPVESLDVSDIVLTASGHARQIA
jgi:hypothetical protein